jgi:transcriptional regulator with PAS, ATPase and Fis domain
LLAHAITSLGDRRHQPFVRLNCAAIPESLLESELFGYEEGSFTGALKGGSKGKFLQANNGTMFLDEIGDMPFALQAKILRILQEREIERIGGSYPIPINVRIIAATHANLLELVKQNKFRKDLFFRLHVIPISVPSLRERKEDIPVLVNYYINQLSNEMEIEKPNVEESFIKALMEYHWPGNVRELFNVLQMVVSFWEGSLTNKALKEYFLLNEIDIESSMDKDDLKSVTDDLEKDKIIKAMRTHNGNKIKVADSLGISRSNLYYKMKKFNL